MSLPRFAPDLQEQILTLLTFEHGRNPLTEKQFRPIAVETVCQRQQQMWKRSMNNTRMHF